MPILPYYNSYNRRNYFYNNYRPNYIPNYAYKNMQHFTPNSVSPPPITSDNPSS